MPVCQTRPAPAPLLNPGETVVLSDGVCKLCNGWARFLIRHDHPRRVRLAAVQSPEGQAARNRYRLFGKSDSCLLPHPDHDQRFLKGRL